MVPPGTGRAKYDGKHQLCERCEQRLSRMKGRKYSCPPGLMCHQCYDKGHPPSVREAPGKRPASAVAPVAPTPKRVRRTQSDPGEPSNLTRKRTRAQPPSTVPAPKKTRVQPPPIDPSLLLDQAHAERLALLAAEKTNVQPADAVDRTRPPTAARTAAATHTATWRLVVCD